MPTILVIIADEPGRHLLDALLNLNGYHVILAETLQKGLQIFRRTYPDVIVLDLSMPERDAVKAVRQVRRLNPCQPMIMLTGNGTSEKEQWVCSLRINTVIEKGDAPRRLVSVLRCLIPIPAPIPPARTRTLHLNCGERRVLS